MAKSLRSKWKRRMRAEKRVRYGEKELDRLKTMLTNAGDYQMVGEDSTQNTIPPPSTSAREPLAVSIVKRNKREVSRKSRKDEYQDDQFEMTPEDEALEEDEAMSVDKAERVYSKRTMKDQFGNYPVWMNKRKIMAQRKVNKRIGKRAKSAAAGKRVRR
ncbi:hypothetical protein Ocin01_14982 [Orchesella cincta]|uniref:Protein LLP n=1 Tax=Orchesella cincta TaxID=48709 RepID=A0A1D2MFG6_ORCCI|nr:hypothetical protein Ocin01_14982 [Orchesella cincta]